MMEHHLPYEAKPTSKTVVLLELANSWVHTSEAITSHFMKWYHFQKWL